MLSGIGKNQTVNQSGLDHKDHSQRTEAKPLKDEYKSALKSISSEQLFEAMKGKPKPDRMILGFIRYPRSTEYKDTVKFLDQFQTKFAEFSDKAVGTVSKEDIAALKDLLKKASIEANEYLIKHWDDKSPEKTSRKLAMTSLKTDLQSQAEALDKLEKNIGHFSDKNTFGDAFLILNSGVANFSEVETPNPDSLVDKRVLGSGQVNTVTIAEFKTEEGDTETRVLKPIYAKVDYLGDFGEKLAQNPGGDAGFRLDKPKIAERNIASANVAKLLNLESMMPMPRITLLDGKVNLDMPFIEGEKGVDEVTIPVPPTVQNTIDNMLRAIENAVDPQKKRDKEDQLFMYMENLKITKKENNTYEMNTRKPIDIEAVSTEPNDLTANFQKALMDLQVLDLLTGQLDRHMGNYIIEVSGDDVHLTAIDNDGSFGEKNIPLNTLSEKKDLFQYKGLPPVMTQSMANSLEQLTPEKLRNALQESGLEQPEIDLAVQRLLVLKQHATNLDKKGLVTDDFKNFKIEGSENAPPTSMSDYLNMKHDGHSNYVHQVAGVQGQFNNDGYLST
jgi:hypothetical protein